MVLYYNKQIVPEAVSTQKGALYDIYSNFKCNGNIIHININDYEGTYNVGDVFHCIPDKGEVNLTSKEKYDNYIIVDSGIDGSDIFINGKIVDDFNIFLIRIIHMRLMYQLPSNFIELLWSKRMK